jgi:hypothetical protein
MIKVSSILFVLVLFQSTSLFAQKPSDFLPEKPGKWSFSSNIKTPGAEVVALNKNLAKLAEWFHQNVPMLLNPKGYDLDAWAYGSWDDHYKMNKTNYALRASIDFNFQLFLSDGGKWTVEPPHYEFDINSTESGHGTNPNYPYFDELQDDPKLEKAINDASIKMNDVFLVYPFVKSIAAGVNLYDCENGGCGTVVVFNPDRPAFWIPVTVRELAEIHLQYYKLRNKSEMDRMLIAQLEKEISELSEEELSAPAFSGHDEHFVLKVNGKRQGLQFMRFNPDYWNRSLPPSAIQFMTFYYPQKDEMAMDESFKNNGHPYYSQLLVNQIDWGKLAGMIQK